MLDESGIASLEMEEEGFKIKLSKPKPQYFTGNPVMNMPMSGDMSVSTSNSTVSAESAKKEEHANPENTTEIKSPMVGTFYRAPSPDADSYVNIGTIIKQGSVICIIEAMKLMNEIESDFEGKIVKILVENGQAVEYDQPLFLIEKI